MDKCTHKLLNVHIQYVHSHSLCVFMYILSINVCTHICIVQRYVHTVYILYVHSMWALIQWRPQYLLEVLWRRHHDEHSGSLGPDALLLSSNWSRPLHLHLPRVPAIPLSLRCRLALCRAPSHNPTGQWLPETLQHPHPQCTAPAPTSSSDPGTQLLPAWLPHRLVCNRKLMTHTHTYLYTHTETHRSGEDVRLVRNVCSKLLSESLLPLPLPWVFVTIGNPLYPPPPPPPLPAPPPASHPAVTQGQRVSSHARVRLASVTQSASAETLRLQRR